MASRLSNSLHSTAEMQALEARIGYSFREKHLLAAALTHPSTTHPDGAEYERLEFLGDAVVDLVVSELLYYHFPQEPEGSLAKRRAALVCRASLAPIGEELGLAQVLKNALGSDSRGMTAALENTLEAIIGAMYLDGGMEPVSRLARQLFNERLKAELTPPKDAKTMLQEWAQGQGLPIPEYRITDRQGPSHAPYFTVEVCVKGHAGITAEGASRKAAEQEAAAQFLSLLEQEL